MVSDIFHNIGELLRNGANINRLRRVLSFFSEDDSGSLEDRVYPGTRLRMIRSGCVIDHIFDGVDKYLLGREMTSEEADEKPKLKTAGGYLKIGHDFRKGMDLSSIDALLREMEGEEGFDGVYHVLHNTISPFGVKRAGDGKGILQFHHAALNRYPMMGKRNRAKFRKGKNDHIYILWVTPEQLIDSIDKSDSKFYVQKETIGVLADKQLTGKSRILNFEKSDFPRYARPDGTLEVPLKVRTEMLNRCGLDWLNSDEFKPHADDFMRSCSIWYSVPRTPWQRPSINVYFMIDIFLYEAELNQGTPGIDFGDGDLILQAPSIVRKYVKENYRSVVPYKILDMYAV